MPSTADEAARALAKWLAPYLAAELGLDRTSPLHAPPVSPDYDDATCAVFVSSLGEVVLDTAEVFFEGLSRDGEIGSLALAEAISVSPHHPLKRRAKALGVGLPWRSAVVLSRISWPGSSVNPGAV